MSTQHTPGPWRWESNATHKSIHLVGGRPQYDLTVMDFERWGMSGAVPRLRDLAHDGMNVMHRVCDRPDWLAAFPGRAHHAKWCAAITHPDMALMAAAPDLLEACVVAFDQTCPVGRPKDWEQLRAAIAKATGAAQ